MARLFDSIVIVDWSAAAKPATGADSIWIGIMSRDARFKYTFRSANPPTRAKAVEELEATLAAFTKRGDRVLLGFDFPLGFPAGTSAGLKLEGAPWRVVRDFLMKEMKDKPDNTNNRFPLAARMNRLISEGPFPFWGCSKKDELTTLPVKKTREHGPDDIAEYRITEHAVHDSKKARPQPVWKLAYAGAVGGLALTGLPAIEKLRAKFPALKIWPFELPLAPLTNEVLGDTKIVVAEVYPAILETAAASNEVRDETRVRGMAEWLEELDAKGKLGPLFAGVTPPDLSQQAKVVAEEGWILGI
jgi:hypothetical protein